MRNLRLAGVVLVILASVSFSPGCGGPAPYTKPISPLPAEWISLGDSPDGTASWYYDANSIDRGETLTTVMVKEIFTGKGKAHIMKSPAEVRGIDENKLSSDQNGNRLPGECIYLPYGDFLHR